MWLPIGAVSELYTNNEKSSPLIVNEACTGLLDFNDPSISSRLLVQVVTEKRIIPTVH